MKKTRVPAPPLVLLCLLSALATSAPLGNAFTYQGQLKDAGLPGNATYDFEFKLFDAAAAGDQISSTLLKEDVVVAGGVFSVSLDFGAAPFAGQARFLEISVRPGSSTDAFTLLDSRQELTPSPNALFATSAGTALTATSATTATTATSATTSTNFSGALAGEVTGTQGATVVSNANSSNFVNTIVRRDAGGSFSATSVGLIGNLSLTHPSTSTTGSILKSGSRFLHDSGTNNTFLGLLAGNFTTTGVSSTGMGHAALQANTTGSVNTARWSARPRRSPRSRQS